jgi:hypothetical protein
VKSSKLKSVAVTSSLLLMFAGIAPTFGVHSPCAPHAGEDAGADDAPDDTVPDCVEVRGEVRYGALGYDHIVHLKNVCELPYVCSVKTDVNPEPIEVTVPPHQEVEVVTVRGSPARVFVPYVTCRRQS